MRALRVVGIAEGGDVVLEDPARRERFTVPADEHLRAAARGDLTRLGQIAIELESQLRPREIQARIRAGASVEQVAAAAGVPLQKIERFAYPVLLERSRTADVAQRAHPVRADGPDARTLGEVVAHTFGLRGQEYSHAEWDSWKGEDGKWVVALSWRAGRSDNRAHWTFQPGAHGGTVTAVDEHASDLVEGLPARPLRTVGPVIDIGRPDEPEPAAPTPVGELRAAASDTVRERAPEPADRPGPERASSRPASEPWRSSPAPRAGEHDPYDVPARASQPRAATDSRTTDSRTTDSRTTDSRTTDSRATESNAVESHATGSRPSDDRSADRRTADRQADDRAAARNRPGRTPSDPDAAVAPPADGVDPAPAGAEPAPAAEQPDPAAEQPDEPAPPPNRRTKKGKPVMPSWDEVLLGVRGQR
jgi:hypothetical protein